MKYLKQNPLIIGIIWFILIYPLCIIPTFKQVKPFGTMRFGNINPLQCEMIYLNYDFGFCSRGLFGTVCTALHIVTGLNILFIGYILIVLITLLLVAMCYAFCKYLINTCPEVSNIVYTIYFYFIYILSINKYCQFDLLYVATEIICCWLIIKREYLAVGASLVFLTLMHHGNAFYTICYVLLFALLYTRKLYLPVILGIVPAGLTYYFLFGYKCSMTYEQAYIKFLEDCNIVKAPALETFASIDVYINQELINSSNRFSAMNNFDCSAIAWYFIIPVLVYIIPFTCTILLTQSLTNFFDYKFDRVKEQLFRASFIYVPVLAIGPFYLREDVTRFVMYAIFGSICLAGLLYIKDEAMRKYFAHLSNSYNLKVVILLALILPTSNSNVFLTFWIEGLFNTFYSQLVQLTGLY